MVSGELLTIKRKRIVQRPEGEGGFSGTLAARGF
jgi:hypothetical protein